MINGEIKKAYRINEQWVGLQWVYSGSTVGLQWVYNEQKTNKRRTMNEEITNLSRRKVEAKAEIKRMLLVDFNFAKDLKLWQSLYKWQCKPHGHIKLVDELISKLANEGGRIK